jgi:DNA-binding CsgD family transcriptional regulator
MQDLDDGFANADVARALQTVAAWTAVLQGDGDLGRAADLVLALFSATYVRLDRIAGGPVQRIYASRRAAGSNADAVVAAGLPRPGRVQQINGGRGAIVVLGSLTGQHDLCEIGLVRPLSAAQAALLDLVAGEMARAWARRQPGLVTRCIMQAMRRHAAPQVPTATAPILDYSNPYGLSRCEYRVCSMMGLGMTARQIAETLQQSEATVRSHQRAIYAKTGMSGQLALLLHLKAHPTAQSLMQGLSRMAA